MVNCGARYEIAQISKLYTEYAARRVNVRPTNGSGCAGSIRITASPEPARTNRIADIMRTFSAVLNPSSDVGKSFFGMANQVNANVLVVRSKIRARFPRALADSSILWKVEMIELFLRNSRIGFSAQWVTYLGD
jgi:hypothetical protein